MGSRTYRFGPFQFDAGTRLLLRDGTRAALPPKALDLLTVLIERPRELVDKDELIKRVWPDTFVEEGNLTKNIFLLRKALGDDLQGNPYIETVPKRGYRFVGALEIIPTTEPASVVEYEERVTERVLIEESTEVAGKARPRYRLLLAAAAFAAFLAMAMWGYKAWGSASPKSILISRFAVSPKADDALGSGFTEELGARLRNLRNVRVISPPASADPFEVGRRFKVDAVLTGRLQYSGSGLRVAAQMTDPRDHSVLWSEEIADLDSKDLYGAQRVVAASLASRLRGRLSSRRGAGLERRGSTNTEAYEAYLRGKGELTRVRLDGALPARHFRKAVELDPGFADAWAGLALSQTIEYGQGRADRERLAAALENANRALSIDPDNIIARRALIAAYHSTGQVEEGLPEAKRVLETDPDDPDAQLAAALAYFRGSILDRALDLYERYLASHPDDEATASNFLNDCLFARKYERGIRQGQHFLAVQRVVFPLYLLYADSGDIARGVAVARQSLASGEMLGPPGSYFAPMVLEQGGFHDEARDAWMRQAEQLSARLTNADNERTRMFLSLIHARLHQDATAREHVRKALEMHPDDPWILFFASEAYALMGKRDAAVDYLRRSVGQGHIGLHYLDYYQRPPNGWSRYRKDPEFVAIQSGLARKVESLRARY